MPEPQVTQMWSRDAFSIANSGGGLRKDARIVTAYQITVPVQYDVDVISQLDDLPKAGDSYDILPEMRVTDRNFTRRGPGYWECLVTYTGKANNPIEEKPIYVWGDTNSSEPIDEDWDGNPIVTANNEPIEGVTMEVADTVLTVRRNFRQFSPWLTSQYRHSVNSDTFASYPPGTARLVKYNAELKWDDTDNGYWDVSATIQFRYPYNTTNEKAWYARVRHEGYYEKVGSIIVRAVDDHQEPVTKPVLLKADGTRETDPEAAVWLEFKKYQPLTYSSLGLID